jgi:hypothetical protein
MRAPGTAPDTPQTPAASSPASRIRAVTRPGSVARQTQLGHEPEEWPSPVPPSSSRQARARSGAPRPGLNRRARPFSGAMRSGKACVTAPAAGPIYARLHAACAQVSRSAHVAANGWPPGSADTPSGQSGRARAQGAGIPGACARVASGRPMSATPDRGRIGGRKQARSGAALRAGRSPAHAGARGHPRRASSLRCAGTMNARSPALAEGQKRKGHSSPLLATCPSAGSTRPSLSHAEQAQWRAEEPPTAAHRRFCAACR